LISPCLSLRGLGKVYGRVVALKGLNLDLQPGECVALLGHNGSGKTTALRLAAGHLEPTEGRVEVLGINLQREGDSPRARSAVAFVADSPVLYDDLTVGEHLSLVGLAHGVSEDLDQRIADLLEIFDLHNRVDFLPGQLSHGLRQKVQLACTFVRPFSVLMLDEPVVGLDPPSQAKLRQMLLKVKTNGAGVLLSTHQLDFARGLADRAVLLKEGLVAADGSYDATAGTALNLGLS
jgi:ABC-2 type transport system ATP-binding protein